MATNLRASALKHALARGLLSRLETDRGGGYPLMACIQHFERVGFSADEIKQMVDILTARGLITITMEPDQDFAPVLRVAEGAKAALYQEMPSAETAEIEFFGQER